MLKTRLMNTVGLLVALFCSQAGAISLDWSGAYRAEWTNVDKPSLDAPNERKSYGLQFLYLSPKIIAADGVNIISRFDVVSNSLDAYSNSQVGMLWGLNSNTPAVTAQDQSSTAIKASQLYLNVNQEYGSLMVGRVPWEFGLGILNNAGKGAFDHWYNTRDMIAYKILIDDWFMMPMLARQQSDGFGQGSTIGSTAFQLQYESTEKKTLFGFFIEQKKGANTALDYTTNQIDTYIGQTGSNGHATASLNETTIGFILGRGFDSFGFKLEGDFLQGETGIVTAGNENVSLNGFGFATEMYFTQPQSKWDWNLKLGMATGDDPNSISYGGFTFHPNYDVAMLMFNHRLGKKDFFQTNTRKNTTMTVGNSADDESLGNTMYIAPSVKTAWSDKLDFKNTLIYAQLLNTQKNSVDAKKDLGLEWDAELIYKPSERIQWVNQIGLLFPGDAWKNGSSDNYSNDFTYGFTTKAAISF